MINHSEYKESFVGLCVSVCLCKCARTHAFMCARLCHGAPVELIGVRGQLLKVRSFLLPYGFLESNSCLAQQQDLPLRTISAAPEEVCVYYCFVCPWNYYNQDKNRAVWEPTVMKGISSNQRTGVREKSLQDAKGVGRKA